MRRVAEAISHKFGVPLASLIAQFQRGRFRARSGVDRRSALGFAAELEALGAVCTVVASDSDERASAAVAATMKPTAPFSPPPAAPLAAPLAPPPPRRSPDYQSGLAAAFQPSGTEKQSLGALELYDGTSSSELKLATLDGHDDAAKPQPRPARVPPVRDSAPRAMAVEAEQPPPSLPEYLDLFLPPEMAQEREIDIAPAVRPNLVKRPSGRMPLPTPPATEAVETAAARPPEAEASAAATSAPAQAQAATVRPRVMPWERFLPLLAENVRMRLAVGALLALLLGFLPAHLLALAWESSAYGSTRAQLVQDYQTVATGDPVSMAALRSAALDIMRSQRRTIALVSCLLWGASAAGIAFLWFRVIDFDRWRRRAKPRAS
jgi:hypothetical protein